MSRRVGCWSRRDTPGMLVSVAVLAILVAAARKAWPVMLVVGAGGLLPGMVVRRSGSLRLPIVVHICFDVPLCDAAVCRLAAPG